MKISSRKLTTCGVADDGSKVGLEFLDQSGTLVTVELPFEQAGALVMTLPRLLASAVRQKTGNQEARYVFGLHGWAIEGVQDQQCLIATLKTMDGSKSALAFPLKSAASSAGICNDSPKGRSEPRRRNRRSRIRRLRPS